MKRIDGRAHTVRELLDGAKYTIDFYQREYAWEERQVRELIDDLTGRFLDFYRPGQPRDEVEQYGNYFLGSIVICHKDNQRFIVDGQQRLTTLTLLLIYLQHCQAGRTDRVEIKNLIFSEKYGKRSFNLDVEKRNDCMEALYRGEPFSTEDVNDSVRTIVERYQNIEDLFPDDLTGSALPYFIDWLVENVVIVLIEADSKEDAYTIFETMNDRGLSLSLPDMLKGYVLANIRHENDQRKVNELWKKRLQEFREIGKEEDVDFFKNWLRARHALTIRPGRKGAQNMDFERIGSEFHRWVRDQRKRLGLAKTESFLRFFLRDMDFYARQAQTIRRAAQVVTPGLESIRFNEDRAFTHQNMVLLAALDPDDDKATVRTKLRLVADYLDIWVARRVWNFRTTTYTAVKYTMFTLAKSLRGLDVPALSAFLRAELAKDDETFVDEPDFRLHQQNRRNVRHVLARLSHWVDEQCGVPSSFDDLVRVGRSRPFEIEHIWPNQYARFSHWFSHTKDFEQARNHIGGLVLLQRGPNQSLGDKPYEEKRETYLAQGECTLTRSLHPSVYASNPSFRKLIESSGLAFKPYEGFGLEEQRERQELYLRIAEWVWNPSRLDLDGIKPPVHEPIPRYEEDEEEEEVDEEELAPRHHARLAFWTQLHEAATQRSDLHRRITPGMYGWFGAQRHGVMWFYVLLKDQVRIELSIDRPLAAENKALFDGLAADMEEVEAKFGAPLSWQRNDELRASRICTTVPGGWIDRSVWPRTIEQAVDAMVRLYAALGSKVEALRKG